MRSLLDTPTMTASAPALTHNAPRLSKTRLVNALQCDRRLWLSVQRSDLVVIDPSIQAVFDAGYRVGEVARQVAVEVLGQGELIDVMEPLGWSGGLERCRLLIEHARRDRTQAVLFEAPFAGPDFAVIADNASKFFAYPFRSNRLRCDNRQFFDLGRWKGAFEKLATSRHECSDRSCGSRGKRLDLPDG